MSIAIDVVNGLENIHKLVQYISWDLKPENVLMLHEDQLVIPQVYINKYINIYNSHIYTYKKNQTICFIEITCITEYGQGIEVPTKWDVFWFRVMLFEMITRKRPKSNVFSDGLDLRKWSILQIQTMFGSSFMVKIDANKGNIYTTHKNYGVI